MAGYQVVEHFVSINGEGVKAGELALFIRLKGCNLQCSYCDTKWANEEDAKCEIMTQEQLRNLVKESGVKNVTITGGEPLYRKDMETLLTAFDSDISLEIETNGSVNLEKYHKLQPRPSFTMDYKLETSGMESAMCLDNFQYLTQKDTVKFVVGSKKDLGRAYEIIETYQLRERVHVYFSPVFGKIEPAEIVDFMIRKNLNQVRIQLQLHKYIWDADKRGV